MSDMTQGGESNSGGQFLEAAIAREFQTRGVGVFEWSANQGNGDLFAPRFLLRNVPYTSIYGCAGRSEFVYRDFRYHDIRIECRWQQVAGSVDEKFPYAYMNACYAMPETEIWFVVDGNGARSGAVDWFKRACSSTSLKTIRVLTIPEARTRIKYQVAGVTDKEHRSLYGGLKR